jgi:hypothetical protein
MSEDESDDVCGICLHEFREPVLTPTNQKFCRECITLWLQHKPTCPNTNQPLCLDFLSPAVDESTTRVDISVPQEQPSTRVESLWTEIKCLWALTHHWSHMHYRVHAPSERFGRFYVFCASGIMYLIPFITVIISMFVNISLEEVTNQGGIACLLTGCSWSF